MAGKLKDLPNFIYSSQRKAAAKDDNSRMGNLHDHDKESTNKECNSSMTPEEDPYFTVTINKQPITDDFTLVRSKKPVNSPKQGSLVGLRDGVPGAYSGFEQVQKYPKHQKEQANVKKEQSASSSAPGLDTGLKTSSPVRPPRRSRAKSGSDSRSTSDRSTSESEYDVLWQHAKEEERRKMKKDTHGSVYSVLKIGQDVTYDMVEEDDATVMVTENDKDGAFLETGVRIFENGLGDSPRRPQSTVVLPLLADDEAGSDSDSWATDFEDYESNAEEVDNDTIYEVIGPQSAAPTGAPVPKSDYDDLAAIRRSMGYVEDRVPPLPPRSVSELSLSDIEDPDKMTYVPVKFKISDNPPPMLPPLHSDASEVEARRYRIIKCLLENERGYMITLHRIFQEYEQPLKEKRIISKDRVKVIFHFIHEIEQCHQLFNMALSGRMAEWVTKPSVGDIIYASFSKSTVLKAYSNFARNFTRAMDNVKETCKLVPAFLHFLKNRLYRSQRKHTLYDLLKQPLERLPKLIVLVQDLLTVTPFPHQDHMSLQLALTELECLSETVNEKRRDVGSRHKVMQLDKHLTGLNKGLSSKKRYYIRHDDMLLCLCENGQLMTTKLRRLFMLSDLLICAKLLNKTKQLATLGSKRYKVKWCVPLVDVEVVDVDSGITVNMDSKTTTTIKYTHPVSTSPRPNARGVQAKIEDLQHDLTIIGQIAGLVASLRGSHEVLNSDKVNEWHREVRDLLDYETEMANMNWLELSLPAKNGRTTCLFNLSTARRKLEWTAELDNAKLRLSYKNNPGWYLPDEEGISSGGTAVLRRTLPLLSCSVPLFMVEQRYTIECIVEVTHPHPAKPVLWIFSGSDHAGQITLMEMSMSSVPHVIESFCACNSRISSAEVVKEAKGHFNDPYKVNVNIWCGTVAGFIEVFDGSCDGDHKRVASARLKDSVVCLKQVGFRVFAGVADGTVACFRKKTDGSWDYSNPTVVMLGQHAVLALSVALGRLWCSCGGTVMVLDVETLGIESTIKVAEESKPGIKHLESYGVGVWVSTWKSGKLELYHAETYECLQTINVGTPVARMKNVIDSEVQNVAADKLYITSLLAHDGILWVGTDVGIILTYPLPRLGGVPQVSGRPCVSFHAHCGPVRCLRAFRVTRNLKQRELENGSQVSRSLFYSNPYDDVDNKETDLDAVNVLPRNVLGPAQSSSESTSMIGEPFYFTVEPDKRKAETLASDPNEEYDRWVSSFARSPVGQITRKNKRTGGELGYYSDESIDSDSEFCFIEDRKNTGKGKHSKSSTYLSVNIGKCANMDGKEIVDVITKTQVGDLAPLAENEFAETMSQFSGFEETLGTPDMANPVSSSTPDTDLVKETKGKTFPLSAAAAKVEEEENTPRLHRMWKSREMLYEQAVDDYIDVNELDKTKTLPATVGDHATSRGEESLNLSRHYRYAPLPALPSIEVDRVEECVAASPILENINGGAEERDGSQVTHSYDEPDQETDEPGNVVESGNLASLTMDEVGHNVVVQEICSKDETAPKGNQPGEEVSSLFPSRERDSCSEPISSEAVDSVSSNEGGLKTVQGDQMGNLEGKETEVRSEEEGKHLCLLAERKTASETVKLSETREAIAIPPQCRTNEETDDAQEETSYTPLLPGKKSANVADSSAFSGAGLEEYDRETALSASLLRESPKGYYTTLVSGSQGTDLTKRELLLQPWYVVTVGLGHMDYRKKPTRSSAKDFLRSFRSSDPDPQLLVWKITSG